MITQKQIIKRKIMRSKAPQILSLRLRIKQIEKEQDDMGVTGYKYLRSDRIYGNDWVRLNKELKEMEK